MVLGSSAGVGAGTDLKNPDEVKDYLDNLGTEYRFGCYGEKNPQACHLLADYMESVKKDFAKAFKVYKTNCVEYKYGHSCHKAAGYIYVGKGCQKDPDLAYQFFRKGCDLKYANSCLNAGILEASPITDKRYARTEPLDPKMASELFKRACEGDIGEGCYRYASMFIKGVEGVIQKDMEEAFKFSLKACELGDLSGCVNTSMMFARGDGVEKNPEKAEQYGRLSQQMIAQMREDQAQLDFAQGT